MLSAKLGSILAQLFQRSRLKYDKVNGRTMDDGRTTDANTSHDPLGELKRVHSTRSHKL
jgi:hypothetical protein